MVKRKLALYRQKRNFDVTSEPSDEAQAPAPRCRLRFVVQKHAATRLHFDLRLELDGVFKSWAVTRGPSLDPHDRRLAVEVEDHPIPYGDFEGVIPKGQYGGGTVQLWDRGYWAPEDQNPAKALREGNLKFVMEGERLHGGWALVRMADDKPDAKRHNWLLIKHKDEAAMDAEDAAALMAEDRSVASDRTMDQIAHGRGKAPEPFIMAQGRPADAVWNSDRNDEEVKSALAADPTPRKGSAKGGRMPDFVAPELCKSVERPPPGSGWAHEIKFDGYRVQMRVAGGKAAIRTRKGLDWTAKFAAIAREGSGLPDTMIDGEICALDKHGQPDFAALQAALADDQDRRADPVRLRPVVRGRRRPAAPAPARAQGAAASAAGGPRGRAHPLCGALRDRGPGGAGVRVPAGPGGHRVQAAGRALSLGARRGLD